LVRGSSDRRRRASFAAPVRQPSQGHADARRQQGECKLGPPTPRSSGRQVAGHYNAGMIGGIASSRHCGSSHAQARAGDSQPNPRRVLEAPNGKRTDVRTRSRHYAVRDRMLGRREHGSDRVDPLTVPCSMLTGSTWAKRPGACDRTGTPTSSESAGVMLSRFHSRSPATRGSKRRSRIPNSTDGSGLGTVCSGNQSSAGGPRFHMPLPFRMKTDTSG
jgi:hypothetical protein